MAASQTPGGLRERAAHEEAVRKRALSVRLGSLGILLLFLGAIGTVIWPDSVATFLVAMVAGFTSVLAAFLVIRRVGGSALRIRDLVKSR